MTRSTTPATPRSRTAIPHSSSTSRRAASAVVSPRSTRPPGMLHWPAAGLRPRRTRRTRSPSRTTAPTPTRGGSGYSREVGGEPAALIPLGGPVLVAHEPVDELLFLAREPPRPELDPVRAGEALGHRGRRCGEAPGAAGGGGGDPGRGPVVVDRAAAGRRAQGAEAPPPAGGEVQARIPSLAVADRDGGRRPAEEAHGRQALAREPPTPQGLVD